MALQQPLDMLVELAAFGGQRQAFVVPIEELETELGLERAEQPPDLRLGTSEPDRSLRYRSGLDEGAQRLQTSQPQHLTPPLCEKGTIHSLLRI
nr:hypothetical protein [Bosea robiniae]